MKDSFEDSSLLSKNIIIAGSTRGLGYGLAEAFLSLGCSVTVSGRGQEAVDKAVAGLASGYEAKRILGLACNVTIPEQVQSLWDVSIRCFGKVDIWINWTLQPRGRPRRITRPVHKRHRHSLSYGNRVTRKPGKCQPPF